uniref:IS66 family transposase n=2 Tax=Rhodocyclales TaxID=206389 RepID=A0ABX1NPI1_9RHOO|nr:IS66 family transposase [Aromatoleum toluolicum]
MDATTPLPDDQAVLKALVTAQQAEIARLNLIIAKLRRMQFGRRSEQLDATLTQLELALEGIETVRREAAADVSPDTASGVAPSPKRPARKPLPDHLPRETVEHAPIEVCCPDCGSTFVKLGEDVSEMLEYVPAHFKVIRHVRPKLACSHCERIVQAAAPSRPISRGLSGPALLAHVLVGKFCDHLPLYRQSAIYARSGIELDRSTLADWVGQSAQLLDPLVEALRRYVLAADKVHADDTPLPVLAPGEGRTKTARLWTYVRDDRPAGSDDPPAVWFAYSPNRKGEHPQRHLRTFNGILQADAYAGFDPLYATGRVQEAACWAHVRRKFFDVHRAQASPIAAQALAQIGQLYAIEAAIRGEPPPIRREVRHSRARPQLEALHAWLETQSRRVSRKSGIAEAIQYALNHWGALIRYVEDGRIEIDNNAAERALRAVALGRKNFLFGGSDAGGERAAALYSLIGSAKLNGLDPE